MGLGGRFAQMELAMFSRSIAMSAVAVLALALLGWSQSSGQPTTADNHPPAGHPTVLKPSADWPEGKAEDVGSPESVVAAYYAVVSGKPGEARDWTRFRSLFHPEARLIPARPTGDGGAGAFFLSPDDFVHQNEKYFNKSGFVDKEAAHRIEAFGNIAHVWSTYESRRSPEDESPYARGIASFQLLKDRDRWWIVSMFWDFERTTSPIPEKYLSTPASKE